MVPDYFDMLSGFPIYIDGVGHIKSPLLKDLCPPDGLGNKGYNLYLNVLSWDKEAVIKYNMALQIRGAEKLNRKELQTFDVITFFDYTRELIIRVLSFFMLENLKWDQETRSILAFQQNEESQELVGVITRDNYDDIRKLILKLNYIGLSEEEAPVRHSSQASKDAWEKVQEYLEKQAKKSEDKPEYHLSNIVSKLCACHPSYNLLNVYNLTIFQMYDAFFQLGFIRGSNLNERIFSQHGGKSFKFEEWLKPLIKNI